MKEEGNEDSGSQWGYDWSRLISHSLLDSSVLSERCESLMSLFLSIASCVSVWVSQGSSLTEIWKDFLFEALLLSQMPHERLISRCRESAQNCTRFLPVNEAGNEETQLRVKRDHVGCFGRVWKSHGKIIQKTLRRRAGIHHGKEREAWETCHLWCFFIVEVVVETLDVHLVFL